MPLPDEALAWFRVAVGRHYGVRFGAVGLNYYRDGADSVAFHADRELRLLDDTLVAIVTLGAARPFLLRPQGGGRSIDIHPASGDLLVMGGACQATWEHGVPKVAGRVGPADQRLDPLGARRRRCRTGVGAPGPRQRPGRSQLGPPSSSDRPSR